jgi:L-2-amino-thiazoline-4-carboxylic acid hydrolase
VQPYAKPKLLKEFDRTAGRVKSVFVSRYGEESTQALVLEARQAYEALIPQLPYIGGQQPFTQFLISTAWLLAMYRVLQRRGEPIEEVGRIGYDVMEAYLRVYPRYLRRFLAHMTWSRRYLRRLQDRAAESQQRRYPGDYVYSFVEGDGLTFDYGVDYTECATVKFLNEQGAAELAPYLCAADILYSQALGWGLQRTTTLAEGAERCDFRFKRGGETRVVVSEPLRTYISGR